jgi:hypothetical protein
MITKELHKLMEMTEELSDALQQDLTLDTDADQLAFYAKCAETIAYRLDSLAELKKEDEETCYLCNGIGEDPRTDVRCGGCNGTGQLGKEEQWLE